MTTYFGVTGDSFSQAKAVIIVRHPVASGDSAYTMRTADHATVANWIRGFLREYNRRDPLHP